MEKFLVLWLLRGVHPPEFRAAVNTTLHPDGVDTYFDQVLEIMGKPIRRVSFATWVLPGGNITVLTCSPSVHCPPSAVRPFYRGMLFVDNEVSNLINYLIVCEHLTAVK